LLYALSIPWYREAGARPETWGGLPDWVAVALGCYVAIAVLNAIAWLLTDVPDALPELPEDESRRRDATSAPGDGRERRPRSSAP
jgi:hypothetical protein